eukprot:jgi/Tetstr1/423695/TSEL_014329.t1
MPQLRGRRVLLLHEDNMAVVAALTNLTSRSPVMMEELRTLWHLLDIHDISIRPRYIQSAANVWADRLSTEPGDANWQLNPRIFAYLQRLVGYRQVYNCASHVNCPAHLRICRDPVSKRWEMQRDHRLHTLHEVDVVVDGK